MGNRYNFITDQGNTLTFGVRLSQKDGTPIDITALTLYFSMKSQDTGEIVHKVDITEHYDPTHGLSVISLNRSLTKDFVGQYEYEVRASLDDTAYKPVGGYMLFNKCIRDTETPA